MDNLFLSKTSKSTQKVEKKNMNQYKDQTIKSLYEVESFLSKAKNALNKIKIVKALK